MINIFKNIEYSKLLGDFSKLKYSVSDWIVAIDTKQYESEKTIKQLQSRIAELEAQLRQLRFQNGR